MTTLTSCVVLDSIPQQRPCHTVTPGDHRYAFYPGSGNIYFGTPKQRRVRLYSMNHHEERIQLSHCMMMRIILV